MIGVENESSLHRELKYRYAEGGETEIKNCGYVCDCVNGSGDIIEIQTGSFAPLCKKLKFLCKENRVKIVHPIIEEKHIAVYDNDKRLLRTRKSPKHGSKWDLFNALVYAPGLPLLPNLSIELVFVDVLECRKTDGKGSWRRGGVSISDRILQKYKQCIPLYRLRDYLQFIPFRLNESFTAASLALIAGLNGDLARKTLYTLKHMDLIEQTGKLGRSYMYHIKREKLTAAAGI